MNKAIILFVFSFFITICCYAQSALSRGYQASFAEGKIKRYFSDIKKQTGIEISYSEASINTKLKVTLSGSERTVGDVLRTLLATFAVSIKESGNKILIIPIVPEAGQESHSATVTLSGFIKDSNNKEILIGASVYAPETGKGVATNNFGFYSLTLPAGKHRLVVSYVGYLSQELTVEQGSKNQDIELTPNLAVETVQVTEKVPLPDDRKHLKVKDITFYTSLLGDDDILKALQHLPGVQSAADGTTNLIVRGGDPGQNLNLLDGVPLYYTDHFYGISSIYNTDALKTVDFYSGAFPARFGGRLSSIIDVNTKDGDMEQWGGVVKAGLLNGSLSLNGPLIKDKASAVITARRSWMDLLWRPFDNTIGVNFYDVNAKVNYIINDKNRIFLSAYNGRDHFRVRSEDTDFRTYWGNTFISLKWNTVVHRKVFVNSVATYSTYSFNLEDVLRLFEPDTSGNLPQYRYKGITTVREQIGRTQLYYYANPNHKIEAGLKYARARFEPANVSFADGHIAPMVNGTPAKTFTSHEITIYAEDEWKIHPKLRARAGLHWANWISDDYKYASVQPRLYLHWQPAAKLSIYGSLTRMAQFLHLLSNNTSGFPTDFWLPSTAKIKPETSWLSNLGFSIKQAKGLSFGAELYYKRQKNLVTFRGGQSIFEDPSQWEGQLTQGKGWGYGAEFQVRKETDRFTATMAYTLSWSFRQFDQLNNGAQFPYRYDRRHNLRLDGKYSFSKSILLSAGWTYMSGEAITLPDQVYPDFDNNLLNNTINYGYTYNYTGWNNYRLPAIHRLVWALKRSVQKSKDRKKPKKPDSLIF